MKVSRMLFAAAFALGLASAGGPAYASLSYTGVCPPTLGLVGGSGVGNATDCNLLIIFNANGSITTEGGPQTTYDGIEDALIGVVNLTGHVITSFAISGPGIFGFDGDGICTYVHNCAGNTADTTGYGGPHGYFTGIVGNSGTVNFLGGIAANGGQDYFSLEEPININAPPIIRVPEPATIALLGIALVGMGFARRRS